MAISRSASWVRRRLLVAAVRHALPAQHLGCPALGCRPKSYTLPVSHCDGGDAAENRHIIRAAVRYHCPRVDPREHPAAQQVSARHLRSRPSAPSPPCGDILLLAPKVPRSSAAAAVCSQPCAYSRRLVSLRLGKGSFCPAAFAIDDALLRPSTNCGKVGLCALCRCIERGSAPLGELKMSGVKQDCYQNRAPAAKERERYSVSQPPTLEGLVIGDSAIVPERAVARYSRSGVPRFLLLRCCYCDLS
jgi:hypothetical protein